MGLRWNVVLVTCGLLLAGLVGLYLALNVLIGASFDELEERQARAEVARAANGVRAELAQLSRSVRDWATWDASYAFMAGEAPSFLQENMLDQAFMALDVSVIAFVDLDGRPVATKAVDLAAGGERPLPTGLVAALEGIASGSPEGPDRVGVVLLPDEVLLLASRPILTSSGEGPPRGWLVMARILDSALERRIAEVTALDLALARADRPPADWLAPGGSPPTAGSQLVQAVDRHRVVAVGALQALDGGPGLLLRVTLPREIHAVGKRTRLGALASLLLAGVLFAVGIGVHLERSVVARVLGLRAALSEVEASGNLSRRLPEDGRDELTELAAAANRTLASLEASRRELEEREALHHAVMLQAWEGVVLAEGESLEVVEANAALTDLLGQEEPQVIGRPLQAIVNLEPGRLEEALGEVRRRGRHFLGELRLRRSDGRSVAVEASGAMLRRGGRELLCMVVRDLTERRKAEASMQKAQARLQQAHKMEAVGRLAGGVAHDFNNLLQVILGLVEVIRSHTDSLETRDRVLGELEEHAHRGAQLTRQLLLFSRRQASHVERLDLTRVVADATALLRRLVRENVILDVEVPGDPLAVSADRAQLEQVLMNLVLNASEALPEGGRVGVRAWREEDSVCLEVADSGAGIPEELQGLVFEPFFTTKEHGTGLGLAVVHGVVTGAGGTVELASRAGRGTSVTVCLPWAGAGASSAVRDVAASTPARTGGGERILVVEDDAGVRFALSRLLGGEGYQVETAGSGGQALSLQDEPAFDLILTDQVLPDTTGVALAAHLAERWPAAAVLLMSGYTEDDDTRDRVARGALRFLAKPFSAADLMAAVGSALASRQPPASPRERSAPSRMTMSA